MTSRTPSSNASAPDAVSAVYSPRLCPAQKLRFDAEPLDGVEHHQAGHERGELGVAGVLQLVGVGVAEQRVEIALGVLAGLVDQLPAVVLAPRPTHAGTLRSLAGEDEGEHRAERRRWPWSVPLPPGSRRSSKWYAYPRYFFSDESPDIRWLFVTACAELGVESRPNRRNSVSVARRESVAILDRFVGPKC